MADEPLHGVMVTLPEIFAEQRAQGKKLDQLTSAVGEMVAVNKRLDSARIRQDAVEGRVGKLEAQVAAQWVIVGIVITVIGAALIKALLN